jgi:hypothetical protein
MQHIKKWLCLAEFRVMELLDDLIEQVITALLNTEEDEYDN